jgi:hypothetical protein
MAMPYTEISGNGVTTEYNSWGNPDKYIGADGKAYSSYEAANRASEIYNKAAANANESAKLGIQQQKLDIANQRAATRASAANSQMTNEFLSKWGDMNSKALDMIQKAISGESGGGGGSNEALKGVIDNINTQLNQFDTDYGNTSKEAYGIAMNDLRTKNELTNELRQDANPDYKNVEGRTAADVAGQSEIARQGIAMNALSYGVDPTAGKFGALTKKSYLSQAANTVDALNKARVAEKTRSTNLKMDLKNSIDPNTAAGIGANLNTQKNNLLSLQTSAAGSMSAADTARLNAITQAAGLVTDMGSQYGSLGATMAGMGYNTETTPAKREVYIPGSGKPLPKSGIPMMPG